VRRTAGVAGEGADRFLLDTIGELRAAYSLAQVVVVGRSFGDLYGSDPIEPASLGRATVIGPRVSDFARIVEALEEAGGIVRTTREDLAAVLGELLASEGRRRSLGAAARACVAAQQGASERHAALVLSLLREPAGA
jgi:3-deoxy-D-manno-octulosonic-acid transferase